MEKNIAVNKKDTKVSGYAVAKSYLVSFSDVTFVFTPIQRMFSQSVSINMLLTFFFT
jgi:hypothetical protein